MKNLKAQAALEFMMTYGWAVIVVLIAIGALAYFGVLDPSKLLPEKTTGPTGMDALDKASIISSTKNVQISIQNNMGVPVVLLGSGATSGGDTDNCGGISSYNFITDAITLLPGQDMFLNNGDKAIISITCNNAFSPGSFKSEITIQYINNETGIQHPATYSITGSAS